MRFRGKLEAGIVKQSNKLINTFRCVLGFLPKDCGSALVHIGDANRLIESVGDSLKQRWILLFRLFRGQRCNLRQRSAKHLATIRDYMRTRQSETTGRERLHTDMRGDGCLAIAS